MSGILKGTYDQTIRPYLPRKRGEYAGIKALRPRLLDRPDIRPNYKHALIDAIHEHIETNDDVTLIGFGWGVTTVHCIREQPDRITAYEASKERLNLGKQTVEDYHHESPTTEVEVQHALVGPAIDVHNGPNGAERIPPAELNCGDVLIMDCEGAEKSILEELTENPRVILIETHPSKGVPAEDTLPAVPTGYDVTKRRQDHNVPEKDVIIAEHAV